jgi:hypothetical protein
MKKDEKKMKKDEQKEENPLRWKRIIRNEPNETYVSRRKGETRDGARNG